MPGRQVRLQQITEIAERTFAFHFEKPAGFSFKAGQFISMTLIDPPQTDTKGNRRNFTLASAPSEEDLMIATRLRESAFKQNLKAMPIGNEVTISGPFGNLTLTDVSATAVFLTGGIGITPFRSIALQASHDHVTNSLYLFYSNRRPEDAAFLSEFQNLQKANSKFRFIPTMTAPEKSQQSWSGETGYINENMLKKYLHDFNIPIFYIAGPNEMVKAMVQMLSDLGVDQQRIRVEEFPGY